MIGPRRNRDWWERGPSPAALYFLAAILVVVLALVAGGE